MIDPVWIIIVGAVLIVCGALFAIFRIKSARIRIVSTYVLYAKKGEIITCAGGHEICELAEDVYVGETLMSSQFTNWRNQDSAKPLDAIMPCKTCGEPFIKSRMPYGGSWLHINGEWRTTH